jgi:hypothetical protein
MDTSFETNAVFERMETFLDRKFDEYNLREDARNSIISQTMAQMASGITGQAMQVAVAAAEKAIKIDEELALLTAQKGVANNQALLITEQKNTQEKATITEKQKAYLVRRQELSYDDANIREKGKGYGTVYGMSMTQGTPDEASSATFKAGIDSMGVTRSVSVPGTTYVGFTLNP